MGTYKYDLTMVAMQRTHRQYLFEPAVVGSRKSESKLDLFQLFEQDNDKTARCGGGFQGISGVPSRTEPAPPNVKAGTHHPVPAPALHHLHSYSCLLDSDRTPSPNITIFNP